MTAMRHPMTGLTGRPVALAVTLALHMALVALLLMPPPVLRLIERPPLVETVVLPPPQSPAPKPAWAEPPTLAPPSPLAITPPRIPDIDGTSDRGASDSCPQRPPGDDPAAPCPPLLLPGLPSFDAAGRLQATKPIWQAPSATAEAADRAIRLKGLTARFGAAPDAASPAWKRDTVPPVATTGEQKLDQWRAEFLGK